MSSLTKAIKKLNRERNKVTREVLNRTGARTLGNRLIGRAGMHGLGLESARGATTPAIVPPHLTGLHVDPRASGPHRCGGESGRKPFVLKSRVQIAAGALAINTDLADMFASGACDQITATGTITGDVSITEASMCVAIRDGVAAGAENLASIVGAGYFILSVNGIEAARYGVEDFDPAIQISTVVTSGGNAAVFKTNAPLPFPIDFDPDTTYKLAFRLTKAVTSNAVIDLSLALKGTRVAG